MILVGKSLCQKSVQISVNQESLSRDFQHYIPGLYQAGGHVAAVRTCYPMTRQGNKHRTALNEQKFFV